jgi:sensor histidine kinase YesM
VVWPNIAVAVVFLVPLLLRQFADVRDFLRALGPALFYANSVSLFAYALIVALAKWRPRHRLPLGPMLVLCILILVPLGCLLVQLLLTLVDIMHWQDFWSQYFSTMRVCLPLAAVFGMGAFAFASMQQRLEATERRLQDKELAEERARKLAVEARLQSLKARIQPHFLFNTLNSICALIATDPVRAEQMIGRLAAMLRTSLDSNDRRLIVLREELSFVQSYIDIEKARFGCNLQVSFDVPVALEEAKVPPMALQTLVENAVKHGITPLAGGGDIRVAASIESGKLRIEVSDSGAGFDLAVVRQGHGLENLVERLDALFGEPAGLNAWRQDGRCVVEMVIPRG